MYIEYEDMYEQQVNELAARAKATKIGDIQGTLQFRQVAKMENEKDQIIAGVLDCFVESNENFAENYLYRSNYVTLKDIVCSLFVDAGPRGIDGSDPYVFEFGYYTMWDENGNCEEKTTTLSVEDVLEFALKQEYTVFDTGC